MAPEKSQESHASLESLRDKTVADFGEQWTYFRENDGYYASDEFFSDLVEPLLSVADFSNMKCAEIGAGTGNIAAMVLRAGASSLTAVEPSAAVEPLRENLKQFGDRATIVNARGEDIPRGEFDIVLSIGVLHHIPDPAPVVQQTLRSLTPGGRFFVWLYGKEGNATYLAFAEPMRLMTKHLPIRVLHGIAFVLDGILMPPTAMAKRGIPVPMGSYLRDVYGRLAASDRRLVIVDQLKPAWAKYYTEREARALLEDQGFTDVKVHHRHGYSWSVIGTKPKADSQECQNS